MMPILMTIFTPYLSIKIPDRGERNEANTGLDAHLFSAIKEWVAKDWWFKSVAYPGREIAWKDWEDLPVK